MSTTRQQTKYCAVRVGWNGVKMAELLGSDNAYFGKYRSPKTFKQYTVSKLKPGTYNLYNVDHRGPDGWTWLEQVTVTDRGCIYTNDIAKHMRLPC